MTFKEKILPPLVLTLVCAVTCGLLTAAYDLTYVDTTGIITDKLSAGLSEIYGDPGGFAMLMTESGEVRRYENVSSVITDNSGNYAFEVTADGYSKGGLHMLIGFDEEGVLCGISVLDIGETPGLGTRVTSDEYLVKYIGIAAEDRQAVSDIDVMTSATYSSKGLKAAVTSAQQAYLQLKGETDNE